MQVTGRCQAVKKNKGLTGGARRAASSTSKTQAPDRPLSGTEDERQWSEGRPGVVERKGGCEERAQQVRHQQEDGSGLKDFTLVLPERRATQGSCTSTRVVGYSLKGPDPPTRGRSCGLLNGDGVVQRDDGKDVQGEPARERDEQLFSCRQARQQHRRNKGLTEHGDAGGGAFACGPVGVA